MQTLKLYYSFLVTFKCLMFTKALSSFFQFGKPFLVKAVSYRFVTLIKPFSDAIKQNTLKVVVQR